MINSLLIKADLLTYLLPPFGGTGIDTLFTVAGKNRLSRLQRASPSAFLDKYVIKNWRKDNGKFNISKNKTGNLSIIENSAVILSTTFMDY